VHSKYAVNLGVETKFQGRPVERVMELLKQLRTADIYILPNLSLAVLKAGSGVPRDDAGLRAEFIGTFGCDIDPLDLIEEVSFAFEQVCPRIEVPDDHYPEPVIVERDWPTMMSRVTIDDIDATFVEHAERRGVPYWTVVKRLQLEPMASADRHLRPVQRAGRGISPHFAPHRSHRRHAIAPLRQNRYDFADADDRQG
jgi:hypothetical protein